MPLFDFLCPSCSSISERLVWGEEPILCECGSTMTKLITGVHTFVAERDQAINSHQGARQRQWLDSEDSQTQLKQGILNIDKKAANPLSDYLDCFDVSEEP